MATLNRYILYRGNDNVIEFHTGHFLTDAVSGAVVDDATVSVRVLDTDGAELQGSITMGAVDGEAGNYRAIIPDTVDLSAVTAAIVEVTANAGADALGLWKLPASVRDREQ